MALIVAIVLSLGLLHCSHDEPPKPEQPRFHGDLPQAEDLSALASLDAAVAERLLTKHLELGFVVSRERDGGAVADRGDSALFTGLAVGVLGCDEGRGMYDALTADIRDHGGRIHRHPALDQIDTSRDMMLGAAFGLLLRARRCPDDAPAIRDTWALHRAYVEGLENGRLYPDAGNDKQINGGLLWLWDKVAIKLGASFDAPRSSKTAWEAGVVAAPTGPVTTKTACYPIHLTAIELVIAVAVDAPISNFSRFSWCGVTRGAGLPMVEWLCEREPAKNWLSGYVPDERTVVYQHQRCRWESEDNAAAGPGVDFLVLERLASRQAL